MNRFSSKAGTAIILALSVLICAPPAPGQQKEKAKAASSGASSDTSKEAAQPRERISPPAAPVQADYKALASWDYNQSWANNVAIEKEVRDSLKAPETRKAMASRLASILNAEGTTPAAKEFICRQLVFAGSDAEVPILAALLPDERLSSVARLALAAIPGPAPDEALRKALEIKSDKIRVGVINSLAQRRDAQAVLPLGRLASDANVGVASAAISALGKIGGAAAFDALKKAESALPAPLRPVWGDAYIQCADGLVARGPVAKGAQAPSPAEASQAATAYEKMLAPSEAPSVRLAALRGLVGLQGEKALPLVMRTLQDKDEAMAAQACKCARQIPGEAATKALADALPKLPPERQVLLISALGDRRDAAAIPVLARAAGSADALVRLAAVRTLGKAGNEDAVPLLALCAMASEKDEQAAARDALRLLPGDKVDARIVELLHEGQTPEKAAVTPSMESLAKMRDGAIKAVVAGKSFELLPSGAATAMRPELARAAAARKTMQAMPALIQLAKSSDKAARSEVAQALGALATEKDMPQLMALLLNAKDAAARRDVEEAVVAAARSGEAGPNAQPVLDAYAKADSAALKGSFLSAIGRIGDPKGLETITAAIKDPDAGVQKAAVGALSKWPDASVGDTLLGLAKTSPSKVLQVLALRGYIEMAGRDDKRPAKDKLKMYSEAVKLAAGLDEKRLILSGLAKLASADALPLIESYMNDETVKAEAAVAKGKIEKALAGAKQKKEKRANKGK